MLTKTNKPSKRRLKLVLILVVLFVVMVIFCVGLVKFPKPRPPKPGPNDMIGPGLYIPIYDQTLGGVEFTLKEALDMGHVLKASESRYSTQQKDIYTAERFIKVTVEVQNKGKEDIPDGVWDVGNIVDPEGRNYGSLSFEAGPWLPEQNLCGKELKPNSAPIFCSKIYEVAAVLAPFGSERVEVVVNKKDLDTGKYSIEKEKKFLDFYDLIVTPK